jgi:hypothetical protein
MSLKLNSSGGGSVTLQEPSTATNGTLTLPAGTGTVAVNGLSSNIVSGTAQASTSGTAINFTDIPSWAKRITVMFSGVSTSGSSVIQIQLGTSGGFQTTGYLGSYGYGQVPSAFLTTGFGIYNDAGTDILHGSLTLNLLNSSTGIWTFNSLLGWSSRAYQLPGAGSKTLSGTLDRVRVTTVNGTDTFDAGTINILYE